MFKQDPKERWSYNDLERQEVISKHFSDYKKLSEEDRIAEKIYNLIVECGCLN